MNENDTSKPAHSTNILLRAGRYVIFSTMIAVLLLLLLEGLIRLSGLANIRLTRGWGHSFACCGDLRSHQRILASFEENHVYLVETNNLGLRHKDDIEKTSEETFRILAIGDSFTFGPYVSNDQTWPSQLEQRLRKQFPAKNVEVLNAGIAGYTIPDELNYVKEKGLELKPDLVILEVTFNDVSDLRKVQRGSLKRPISQEWFIVWQHQVKNFLRDHSHFFSVLVQLKHEWLAKKIQPTIEKNLATSDEITYGSDTEFLTFYEKYFFDFVNVLSEREIPLLVVYYPSKEMLTPSSEQKTNLSKIQDFLQTLTEKTHVPFLDLTQPLAKEDSALTFLIPWNGHPSAAGYYLMAKELQSFITEQHLLESYVTP